ncbi:MAG: hypothetical protein ACP5JR_00355 [Thermoplasmata archaeon]
MTKKVAKTSAVNEKPESHENTSDVSDEDALLDLAEMAGEFGTDIKTLGEHFSKFVECGIIQQEGSDSFLLSNDFKTDVLRTIEEEGEEWERQSEEEMDADEVRLMEGIGFVTLARLIEHGMIDLEDEEMLEKDFESMMKSMLFLLYVSGEFDELLVACGKIPDKKTPKKPKKRAGKKKTKKTSKK